MKRSILPFLDMIMNLFLIVFVMLIAMLIAAQEEAKQVLQAPTQGVYMLVMDWRDDVDTDIDIWMRDPLDQVLFYANKNIPFADLERDDLGKSLDLIVVDGKEIYVNKNHEVIHMRKLLPGEYVVNANYYSSRTTPKENVLETVTIKLIRVMPTYKEVITVKNTLEQMGQEKTFFRFFVNADGDVISTDYVQVPLVPSQKPGAPP